MKNTIIYFLIFSCLSIYSFAQTDSVITQNENRAWWMLPENNNNNSEKDEYLLAKNQFEQQTDALEKKTDSLNYILSSYNDSSRFATTDQKVKFNNSIQKTQTQIEEIAKQKDALQKGVAQLDDEIKRIDDQDIPKKDKTDPNLNQIWGLRKFNGHWWGLDFGVNTLISDAGQFVSQSVSGTGKDATIGIKSYKSFEFAFNFLEINKAFIRHKLGLTYGLGYRWNNYQLEGNILITELNDNVINVDKKEVASINYAHNSLNTGSWTLPLILEFQHRNNSWQNKKVLYVGFGPVLEWVWSVKTKQETSDGKSTKLSSEFGTNPFRIGFTLRGGYRSLGFFANYSLTPLFRDNKGPISYPFSAGIVFLAN